MITEAAIWVFLTVVVSMFFAVQFSINREDWGKTFLWLLWDFSGLRFVVQKVFPVKEGEGADRRPPATLMIWVLGIYTALFGLASNRYENVLDKIENRASAFITQISVIADPATRANAFSQVTEIQTIPCPVEPEIIEPITIINSFFIKQPNKGIVELMVGAVENQRLLLQDANLWNANLQWADLAGANLQKAFLREANLQEAQLVEANLQEANLWKANLQGAMLVMANLQRAKLMEANLQHGYLNSSNLQDAVLKEADLQWAYMEGANLKGAYLKGANLQEANFHDTIVTADQLCQASSLRGTILDPKVEAEVMKMCPQLLEPQDN